MRIRVQEFEENGTLVVRAELEGVDPTKDVDVAVRNGVLAIRAERRELKVVEGPGRRESTSRQGALSWSKSLPPGVGPADVGTSFRDGVLEVRVPLR